MFSGKRRANTLNAFSIKQSSFIVLLFFVIWFVLVSGSEKDLRTLLIVRSRSELDFTHSLAVISNAK